MNNQSVAVIGYGKMAKAVLHGIKEICFDAGKINCLDDLKGIENYQYIFLGVKPFIALDILKLLSEVKFKHQITIITVVAGIEIESYQKIFANNHIDSQIMRLMPNLACAIKRSPCAIAMSDNFDSHKRDEIYELLSKTILPVEISECQFSVWTVLMGSVTAFYYRIALSIKKIAYSQGFSDDKSQFIANYGIDMASNYLDLEHKTNLPNLQELISNIATPKGITQAGLEAMDLQNVDQYCEDFIMEAINKANQMKSGK